MEAGREGELVGERTSVVGGLSVRDWGRDRGLYDAV